jgi:hypothetical protein
MRAGVFAMTAQKIHGVTLECVQGDIANQPRIDAVVCLDSISVELATSRDPNHAPDHRS